MHDVTQGLTFHCINHVQVDTFCGHILHHCVNAPDRVLIMNVSQGIAYPMTTGLCYHHCLSYGIYGLGQVNGQLVAVGGRKKSDHKQTKEVYTYIEQSRRWKQTVPPMCTARDGCGVLSLQSALVVAGGGIYTNTVEIFKVTTSQWCTTSPTPRDGTN